LLGLEGGGKGALNAGSREILEEGPWDPGGGGSTSSRSAVKGSGRVFFTDLLIFTGFFSFMARACESLRDKKAFI
jgi:hypothetical protein